VAQGSGLPGDEHLAVARHLREFDRLTDDLKVIERDLAILPNRRSLMKASSV
jgi:hypothetical protein